MEVQVFCQLSSAQKIVKSLFFNHQPGKLNWGFYHINGKFFIFLQSFKIESINNGKS
jgi:hypothetical protein